MGKNILLCVLILVLMEDALVQVKAQVAKGFDFKKS